jgi:hypothetical protein
MAINRSFAQGPDVDTVAGNGLLHRRMFLMAGMSIGKRGGFWPKAPMPLA